MKETNGRTTWWNSITVLQSVADPVLPEGGAPTSYGGADSRRGYISKILYVNVKESGPLGRGTRLHPPGSANCNENTWCRWCLRGFGPKCSPDSLCEESRAHVPVVLKMGRQGVVPSMVDWKQKIRCISPETRTYKN